MRPIGKNFGQTLRNAIDHRQTGPVFLSPKGEPWSVGNLSTTHRRLRDAAGLARDLVLCLARHRFGTEALRAGLPTALWPVSGTAAKSGGRSHAARPQVS